MAASVKRTQKEEVNIAEELSEDRDSKIAESAYYKAENRGFEPGHELEDWLEAEREFTL